MQTQRVTRTRFLARTAIPGKPLAMRNPGLFPGNRLADPCDYSEPELKAAWNYSRLNAYFFRHPHWFHQCSNKIEDEDMIKSDREMEFILTKDSGEHHMQWQWLLPLLVYSAIWFYGLWCLAEKIL